MPKPAQVAFANYPVGGAPNRQPTGLGGPGDHLIRCRPKRVGDDGSPSPRDSPTTYLPDFVPPAAHGSTRACTPSSCARPDAPTIPVWCEYRTPPRSNASRTSAETCDTRPASRSPQPTPRGARPAAPRIRANDAGPDSRSRDFDARAPQETPTATPSPAPPQVPSAPTPPEAIPALPPLRGPARGAAAPATDAPPTAAPPRPPTSSPAPLTLATTHPDLSTLEIHVFHPQLQ